MRQPESRAPTLRTYQSGPALRQKRFSTRIRHVRPCSTTMSAAASKKQQTLTQIEFPAPSSNRRSVVRNSEESDNEWESPRPQKRSRKNWNGPTESQKTLTQIDFFMDGARTDEDELDGGIEDGTHLDARKVDQAEDEAAWHKSFLDEPRHSEDPQDTGDRRSITRPQTSWLKSPSKPIKNEISSSQSPAQSPISTQQSAPSHTNRTPLQEIPRNVFAQRDEESPTKSKKTMKTTIEDSQWDDFELDEDENLDPNDDSNSRPLGTPTSDYNYKESVPGTPMQVLQSPNIGSQGQHQGHGSNIKQESPSQRGHHSSPTPITPSKHNPTPPQIESSPPQSRHPTQKPTQPSEPPVPFSQATTVDLTQPSPRQAPGTSDPDQHVPASSPARSSQTSLRDRRLPHSLATVDSQFPDFRYSHVSPVASINDSADIETFSPLESEGFE